MSFLNLDAEEAVAARADGIAARACDPSLLKTRLKHQQSFVKTRAHHFAQARDDFAIGRVLCALEKQGSALCLRLAGGGEEVEDAVVVDFVHANHDRVLRGRVDFDIDVVDRWRLRELGDTGHVSLGRAAGGEEGGFLKSCKPRESIGQFFPEPPW